MAGMGDGQNETKKDNNDDGDFVYRSGRSYQRGGGG